MAIPNQTVKTGILTEENYHLSEQPDVITGEGKNSYRLQGINMSQICRRHTLSGFLQLHKRRDITAKLGMSPAYY